MTQLRGEYWIQNRRAVGADGDAGDDNHLTHAVLAATAEMLDAFLASENPVVARVGMALWKYRKDCDPTAIRCEICDLFDGFQRRGQVSDEEADDPYAFLASESGVDEMTLHVVCRSDDNDDARTWAMRTYGWIRVVCTRDGGCHAELWGMNDDKLEDLREGLFDIAGDEPDDDTLVWIEDRKTGQQWNNLPWRVLSEATMLTLRCHARLAAPETTA